MELGAFSNSLAVKDLIASKAFYQKLGFSVIGGDESQNWLILRNGDHTLGLFQGMFESNIMTFNPGWDKHCTALKSFSDVRELHKACKAQGLTTSHESLEGASGPGSFNLLDPDGNAILFDQHV